MKDYYKVDLELFMKNNADLMREIKSKAPAYADELGLEVVQYVNREIKQAHLDYVASLGVQDPYEYYITQHEEDRSVADKLIADHRAALSAMQ